MKEQYVGDINDYWKYCLLKGLSQDGAVRIGVCWMLTPPDGGPDGRKIQYLREPETYERFDPVLFRLLQGVLDKPDARRLVLIEASGVISGAIYFNAFVPDGRAERKTWFMQALSALQDADLLFFDPDNGLNVPTVTAGQARSSKYLFRDEVALVYAKNFSLLIYQHFPRENRRSFVHRIAGELRALMPLADLWLFNTQHAAFFMAVHPDHQSKFGAVASAIGQKFDSRLSVEHMDVGSSC